MGFRTTKDLKLVAEDLNSVVQQSDTEQITHMPFILKLCNFPKPLANLYTASDLDKYYLEPSSQARWRGWPAGNWIIINDKNINIYIYTHTYYYPIARWANPATVPGMRAGGSIYEGLKLYINLLKVLESCKVLR